MRIFPTSEFEKELEKLYYRDRARYECIKKKILHIAKNPYHYKPLKGRMKGFRRVHFGSYVLVYKIEGDAVCLIALDHHDFAYD